MIYDIEIPKSLIYSIFIPTYFISTKESIYIFGKFKSILEKKNYHSNTYYTIKVNNFFLNFIYHYFKLFQIINYYKLLRYYFVLE